MTLRQCVARVALILALTVAAGAAEEHSRWYAGRWDSTIYNLSERPRTVGVRIEVEDEETGLAVPGAAVTLKGVYVEEYLTIPRDRTAVTVGGSKEREFELSAVTGRDGVVVFALRWQKKYPWSFGERPKKMGRGGSWTYDEYKPWIRAVDDVEKVQVIEVRHPLYQRADIRFDFRHLLKFGQDTASELQEPRIYRAFQKAWVEEINRKHVTFCVLDLGTKFPDFNDRSCTRPEFFQKVRDKDFAAVYTRPQNWFSWGEHPQSICGPYFVYVLPRISLRPRSGRVDVIVRRPERRPDDVRRDEDQGEREATEKRKAERRWREQEERERRGVEARREREREEARARQRPKEERRKRERPERQTPREEPRASDERRVEPVGISFETLTRHKRKELGLFVGVTGALVTSVEAGSPAAQAGLQPGMVIYAVEHRVVSTASDLEAVLRRKKPGDQFLVGFWRKRGGRWERDGKFVSVRE